MMLNKIINYISNWQLENDSEFKPVPTDNHSKLIFNYKNKIFTFIFSNQELRDKCKDSLSLEISYNYIISNDEDGITFYDI